MRQLGLSSAVLVMLAGACKAAPEPAPGEASAPVAAMGPPPLPTPTASAQPAAPVGTRVYGESAKTISAKVGERFAVALPSNLSIPMKWRQEGTLDAALLALVDEKHADEPPAGCGDCVGYGGTRTYTFEAKAPGSALLKFALKPLTDPSAASQKDVAISVTVAR